jgi:hypothetical protein
LPPKFFTITFFTNIYFTDFSQDPELALSTAAAAYVEGDVVKMIEEVSPERERV